MCGDVCIERVPDVPGTCLCVYFTKTFKVKNVTFLGPFQRRGDLAIPFHFE